MRKPIKKGIVKLTLVISVSILSLNHIGGQTLLHQINRGDSSFNLYDDGFKINSVSTGNTLLETYKLGAELPIGIASYPFSDVNYANYIHLVVQDNALFNQWMTNSITSWTANDPLYQLDAVFQNTILNEGFNLLRYWSSNINNISCEKIFEDIVQTSKKLDE